ncbi:MAG TPA: 16S rRNA (guanine(527)-N(7))-methyltransferase RsmG [Candidatus Binatia bacterium]|nr:16S rRNA (guanine(527)-N(7))-methyltransferase RsmG [Candidatus Binatia bacterium]
MSAFARYLELLIDWNRVHRLVGTADPAWIVEKLFLDSLLFVELLPRDAGRIADLGSGAGIPGVPLKIVLPELHVALVESRRKRASFLRTVAREMGLRDVEVVNERIPGVVGWPDRPFDAVVARCAGDPAAIARAGVGLVRPGGPVIIAASPTPRPGQPGRWVQVRGRSFLVVSVGEPG